MLLLVLLALLAHPELSRNRHRAAGTGFISEGHFVNDDWLVAKAYLKGSFFMDVLGTFPLNIVTMIATPDNPYGDAQLMAALAAADQAAGNQGGMDPGRANRMLRLMRMAKLAKLARMRKLAKYVPPAPPRRATSLPPLLAIPSLIFSPHPL